MKYDQGFVTWSPRSLTQGEAKGQGTVASSTSDQRFNQNILAVESLFVRENSGEPVPFTMYARGFDRFVSLGISPGKNYPGITSQNLLVHIFVPRTTSSWEAFAGCLVDLPYRDRIDDQDYMRTDLPVLEAGDDDPSFFDLKSIVSEFGFNEDKNHLADFLQRSVSAILAQSGTLLIALPDRDAHELRRLARRVTWLIAMAMPKPAGNTMRYIRNISYGVGTKDNASKATIVYAACSEMNGLSPNQVIHLDSHMAEKKEEEILPVFRALSDSIIEYGKKNENYNQLIRELEGGKDPIWGDLQLISDVRYCNGNTLTATSLNMGYIYWLLEDPEHRGKVSYTDIRDCYSGLLIQTKLGKKWHETMLFNYVEQEDSPDYQSVLALWKEVLSPALKRRDQFDKETWDKYLDRIIWCMKYVYDISTKNYEVFLRQLKNDEDSTKVQCALYEDDSDDNIIDKELSKIQSAEDYQKFINKYRLLCEEYPEVKQKAFTPVSFKVYIHPDTDLEERKKYSERNLPGFSTQVKNYIKGYFTAARIASFFRDELKRTEDQYLQYAYDCLYKYLKKSSALLNDLNYQDLLLAEAQKRNVNLEDPGISDLLEKEYKQQLSLKTIDDLPRFPEKDWIDHLDRNCIDWYKTWQDRVYKELDGALTAAQITNICEACINDTLLSHLGDQEAYKRLFRKLWQAAGNCRKDRSFSGIKSEVVALRIKAQNVLVEVCASNQWKIEITEYDDVWDWKCEDDFTDFYAAWISLSEYDRDKILSFPEPASLRCRISNQNFLRIYDGINKNDNIKNKLEKERLDERYCYTRREAGIIRQLYLEDKAVKTTLKLAVDKFKEPDINTSSSVTRNVLLNMDWVLTLFNINVYWNHNSDYKELDPDQRRIHFYEVFYQSSQLFQKFVHLYTQYYRDPEKGSLYLRQGWRFSKFHEDYDAYLRNSDEIKDAIIKGEYDPEYEIIIRSLNQNLTAGKKDDMRDADIYKKTKDAISEINSDLKVLEQNLRNKNNEIRHNKNKIDSYSGEVANLRQRLDQVSEDLEEKKKQHEADAKNLAQMKKAGENYADAAGSKLTDRVPPSFNNIDRNRGEVDNAPANEEIDGYGNAVVHISPPSYSGFIEETKKKGKRL